MTVPEREATLARIDHLETQADRWTAMGEGHIGAKCAERAKDLRRTVGLPEKAVAPVIIGGSVLAGKEARW